MGHSAGGLSVTQATLKFAKKIQLAVYVAATMLKLGFSTDEDLKQVKAYVFNSFFVQQLFSFFILFYVSDVNFVKLCDVCFFHPVRCL